MGDTFLTCWVPLRPGAWVGSPVRALPFPLEEEGCRLYKFARQGLWRSLQPLGLREGDAVLTPAYHHGSEVGVLRRAGVRCVYYEATESLAPDPEELESLLEPGVRALYLIHNLGFPQDAPRWRSWCDERDLLLIEDVAMSWPAALDGTPLGSWGDVAIFSPWKTYGLPDLGAAIARVPLPAVDPTYEVPASLIVRGHGKWVAGRHASVAALARRPEPNGAFSAEREFDAFDQDAAASRLSIFMLRRLARVDAAAARRENYRRLLAGLGDHVARGFDRVSPEASPFVFPIQTEHKEGLLQALAERRVRALDLWSIPHPTFAAHRFEAAARRRATTIGLPVHQELRPEDLVRMIEIVRSYEPAAESSPTRPRGPGPGAAVLKEGDDAPDFELSDQDGRPVRLSAFAGRRVVLYFYPEADTPGCTAQACALRDRSNELAAGAATVLGVSPDRPAKLKRFAAKHELPFQLLADERHEVAERYGVWAKRRGFGIKRWGNQRTTYLIGPEGQIERVLRNVDPRSHDSLVLGALGNR